MILKERYRNICNEYLQRFCIKQGYHYEPNDAWVAGDAGDCATIGDYVFGYVVPEMQRILQENGEDYTRE